MDTNQLIATGYAAGLVYQGIVRAGVTASESYALAAVIAIFYTAQQAEDMRSLAELFRVARGAEEQRP